jgi:hypothetical protein
LHCTWPFCRKGDGKSFLGRQCAGPAFETEDKLQNTPSPIAENLFGEYLSGNALGYFGKRRVDVDSTRNGGELDAAIYGNDPFMDKFACLRADDLAAQQTTRGSGQKFDFASGFSFG